MKHLFSTTVLRLVLGACLLTVLPMLGATQSVLAGEGQGEYLTQASSRLVKLVNQANGDGYKLQSNSFSMGGGWLTQSEQKWVPLFTINLEKGKEYRCLAAGDNDARDVDLDIVDPSGKVVAADTDTSSEAALTYSPTETGKHLIRIRLYASEKNQPCACLGVVMTK